MALTPALATTACTGLRFKSRCISTWTGHRSYGAHALVRHGVGYWRMAASCRQSRARRLGRNSFWRQSEPDGQYLIAISLLLRRIRGGQCFLNLGELNQGGRIFRADRSVVLTPGVGPL